MRKRWEIVVVWPRGGSESYAQFRTRRNAERVCASADYYRVLLDGDWRFEVRRVTP